MEASVTANDKAMYRVIGVDASPYTTKLRAVLRYRRIPHVWICRLPQSYAPTRAVRPAIMPVVQFPDGGYHTDSTPIIHALEQAHPGARSVLPDDPALAFLAHLIEDMADEWLPKCLFHYRFTSAQDGDFAARWVMDDACEGLSADELGARAADFKARQLERMALVGSIPANASVIAASFSRVLEATESFVARAASDRLESLSATQQVG